jgi:uncharacterized protein (TIGR02246 family)
MQTKDSNKKTTTQRDFTGREQEVRQILDEVRDAVAANDVDRILKYYDKDARLFDVRDTLQHKDLNSYRAYWNECFKSTNGFNYDLHDVQIDVSEDWALCTMLSNTHGTDPDNKNVEAWLRVTVGLRKKDGTWKVVHEHVSVPGDFINMKLLENLKPGEEVNFEHHKH